MNNFTSNLKPLIKDFLEFKHALGIKYDTGKFYLKQLVYTDQIEHTARRYSAWLPPIQCTLSGHQCMMLIQV